MNMLTYKFSLPLKKIESFQFQTRPYEWVEFKNVSLAPGNKTDVQVIVKTKQKPAARPGVKEAAGKWLDLVDEGRYSESWDQAAAYFKTTVTKQKWAVSIKAARTPLGKVKSRKLLSARSTTSLPGAPDGNYVVIQYQTSFENKPEAVETVTPMKGKDGKWRVSGYYVR